MPLLFVARIVSFQLPNLRHYVMPVVIGLVVLFVDTQVVKNADFPELWSTHVARLQPVWHLVRPYEAGADPLACYAANNHARGQAMHARGLIRYLSPEQEGWRGTVKGAMLLTAS